MKLTVQQMQIENWQMKPKGRKELKMTMGKHLAQLKADPAECKGGVEGGHKSPLPRDSNTVGVTHQGTYFHQPIITTLSALESINTCTKKRATRPKTLSCRIKKSTDI